MAKVQLPDLAPGRSVVVTIGDQRILLCRSAKGIHALRDDCPHQSLSMDGARVRGESVICPHHGARFALDDGRSLSPLTPKPLALLPCRIVGDAVEIDV